MSSSLLNEDNIKGFYKAMTSIVEVVDDIAKAFGGIGPII
jgi:hypothetical protein